MQWKDDYEILEDEIYFYKDWLEVEDYELKILILTSILAENNLAYRGNLSNICKWLGVCYCANNITKIKKALKSLVEKGLLFYKLDGRTYTITISEKGMNDKKIITIRKCWINAFKKYNKDENNHRINDKISIDWIKILKVFVFLYTRNKPNNTITMKEIASSLNISERTVQSAIKAIQECYLTGIRICKNTVKQEIKTDTGTHYYNIGSDIGFIWIFDE